VTILEAVQKAARTQALVEVKTGAVGGANYRVPVSTKNQRRVWRFAGSDQCPFAWKRPCLKLAMN
jgi:hypothetical protein